MIKDNRGFTLVELILVIAILGIIGMIAMPKVPSIMQRQRVKADIITGQQIGSAVRTWYIEEKFDESDCDEGKYRFSIAWTRILPNGDGEVTPLKYSDLNKMEDIIAIDKVPESFIPGGKEANNPYYGVYLTTKGTAARIVVTIQDEDHQVLILGDGEGKISEDEEDYDGTKAGIVYME